jgi:magnesium chelatase accessory protein
VLIGSGLLQVREDFGDDLRLLDAGNDPEPAGAPGAALGVDLYARLVRDPAHVEGVLTMMARWDLAALEADLPAIAVPLLLVVGLQDGTVPPSEGRRVRDRVPGAELVELPGLGHLAHEERPATVAQLLREFAQRVGVPAAH